MGTDRYIPARLTIEEKLVLDDLRRLVEFGWGDLLATVDRGRLVKLHLTHKTDGETLRTLKANLAQDPS